MLHPLLVPVSTSVRNAPKHGKTGSAFSRETGKINLLRSINDYLRGKNNTALRDITQSEWHMEFKLSSDSYNRSW